jgi:hypothetical protein
MRPYYHAAAGLFALTLLVACSGQQAAQQTGKSAEPPASCGQDMEWGGWDGTSECAKIAHDVIPAAHLACERNEDCVLVGRSSCGANSVARSAGAVYRDHPPACGHPAAGGCPPIEFVAECRSGCCNVGIAPSASTSGTHPAR